MDKKLIRNKTEKKNRKKKILKFVEWGRSKFRNDLPNLKNA